MKIKKKQIIIIAISIVLAIVVIGIIAAVLILKNNNKNDTDVDEPRIDISKLEAEFSLIFDNNENEYVSTFYDITKNETGKYNIDAKIPYAHISNSVDSSINNDINNIFVRKLLQIYNEGDKYTTLDISYKSAVNENTISLIVQCELKEGAQPKRRIIRTYTYSRDEDCLVDLIDIIPENQKEETQEKIIQKIQSEKKREKMLVEQGYQTYTRNLDDDMYLLENATEFFIDGNVLYIIYSYGNNSYTTDLDLIIIKI